MKKLTLLFALLITTVFGASAQIEDPVSWSYGFKKLSSTEAVVYMKATIEDGWHIYSQNVKPGGPIKTTVKFAPSKQFTKVGVTAEPKPITKYEKTFSMNVSYFENEVIFQQKVKLVKGQALVKGTIEFMTCNDRKCLPPNEVPFSVQVK
ncbi:MAG: sugar transporter [Pedobacter sp.]|nr:MAG: sugar transporter [Pedobacter sp.]